MKAETISTIREALELRKRVIVYDQEISPTQTREMIARIDAALADLQAEAEGVTWEPVVTDGAKVGSESESERIAVWQGGARLHAYDKHNDIALDVMLPANIRLCQRTTTPQPDKENGRE